MSTPVSNSNKLTLDPRSHAFNVGIAIDFSPTMALWLAHLAFWAEKNLANDKHIHDGLVWCYDTLEAIRDYFPYFTKSQIETMINNSVSCGLVRRGNYNHTSYDRTQWYALTPEAYFYFPHLVTEKYIKRLFLSISENSEMDLGEFGNGFPGFRMTIPDTDPNPDPNDCVGEANASTAHTPNLKQLKKERAEKNALESEEVQELFKSRFEGRTVSLQEIFESCRDHYEQKSLWATKKKFIDWLKREKPENYPQVDTHQGQKRTALPFTIEYNAYLSQFKNDIFFKLIPSDSIALTYEEWICLQEKNAKKSSLG